MNICIIGGSGFVGTRLTELLKEQHEVTILDKRESVFYPELTAIGDVRDTERLKIKLKGFDTVILLAAEHRDDVSPTQLYYDVNVQGTHNVLEAMDFNGIKNIIFTSSVAIYGLNKVNPGENHLACPFNHYGKSKWEAEKVISSWISGNSQCKAVILRPTVIFGERNRGNVYNLLKQISSGRFLRIGKGNNYKSMAYVGNVVAFVEYMLQKMQPGMQVYNYIDKPDLSINELIAVVEKTLNRKVPSVKVPYWLGMLGGYGFDVLAWLTRKKLPISSVRIKKFCATTQYDATKALSTGFTAPYTLSEGISRTIEYEFLSKDNDGVVFETE